MGEICKIQIVKEGQAQLKFSKRLLGQQENCCAGAECSDLRMCSWQQHDMLCKETKNKRILIVDDSPLERSLLENFLSKFGYKILVAVDGKAGFEKALSEQPDLIILDVVMPQINGFEVCRMIKSIPNLARIPIFLLTSKSEASDQFWGRKQGADMYMTKPFEPNELLKAVFSYLSRHLLLRYEREERRRLRRDNHCITVKNVF